MNNIFDMLNYNSLDLDINPMSVSKIILADNINDNYDVLMSLDICNTFYYYLNEASDLILLTAYLLSKLLDNYNNEYFYINRE